MALGVETQLGVEFVNTLVTVVAAILMMILAPCMQMWLARVYWESLSRGKTKDTLISEGFSGFGEFFWKVRHSEVGDRCRTFWDLLPYVLVIAALQLLPFSTSGVSATVAIKKGDPVHVLGSIVNPVNEPIETLDNVTLAALHRGDFEGGSAPFLLGSPELGNFGTTITGLNWSVTYSSAPSSSVAVGGAADLAIYGSGFTVEHDGAGQGTYAASTCLTFIEEEGGVYSIDTCDAVLVGSAAHEIVVEEILDLTWVQETGCVPETYAIFNQGVEYKHRNLTLSELTGTFSEEAMVKDTEVLAWCANIFESLIEACIFEVGEHLYVGDWNPGDVDTCDGDVRVNMATIEIKKGGRALPSSEEFLVAASMLAEVVAGTGRIVSRQQLALILGVFSRLAAMKAGVGTAYNPESVVIVTISPVVLLLWGLLFAGG